MSLLPVSSKASAASTASSYHPLTSPETAKSQSQVEGKAKHYLCRTGAAFVSTSLGIRSQPPLTAQDLSLPAPRQTGALIVAGSYVPKTTAQLKVLTDRRGPSGSNTLAIIELSVEELITSTDQSESVISRVMKEVESHLLLGTDTLVMTSRRLITGHDELSSLAIGSMVAEALVEVLRRVEVRPRYIIAKVCFLLLPLFLVAFSFPC